MANITDVELDIRLQELAEGLGLSVYEFVSAGYVNLETYQLNLAAINARLDAIDVLNGSDGVETVGERLETLRNIFETTDGDLITTVIADIAANKSAIESEKAAREAAVAAESVARSLEVSAGVADAKAYADDKFLGVAQIQNLDICAAVNKFRSKLFLAPKVCDGSSNGGNQGGTVGGGL